MFLSAIFSSVCRQAGQPGGEIRQRRGRECKQQRRKSRGECGVRKQIEAEDGVGGETRVRFKNNALVWFNGFSEN